MATTEQRNDRVGPGSDSEQYGTDRRMVLILVSLPTVPMAVAVIGLLVTTVLDALPRPPEAPTAIAVAERVNVEPAIPAAEPTIEEHDQVLETVDLAATVPLDVVPAVDPPTVDPPVVESLDVELATTTPPRAPEEVLPVEPIEPDWRVREFELVEHMQRQATELDFNPHGRPKVEEIAEKPRDARLAALANRDLLAGLPLRGEDECRKKEELAHHANDVSQRIGRIRSLSARRTGLSLSDSGDWFFEQELLTTLQRPGWNVAAKVSTLDQMLQVESITLREHLVATLARTTGPEAAEALANRALFDTSPDVRAHAVHELRKRKVENYRDRLLDGLRHPWAPAAVHAADAFLELRNEELTTAVAALLDEPDPAAPFEEDGILMTRELVRVNHMRNCVLCHAPSTAPTVLVRGLVPTPGRPLPQAYYQGRSRGLFVRADVTYLKQDFSQVHHVEKAKPWPEQQRFDYFVRVRPLTEAECEAVSNEAVASTPSPQRRAQRLALLGAEGGIHEAIARDELRKLLYESTREPQDSATETDDATTVDESAS